MPDVHDRPATAFPSWDMPMTSSRTAITAALCVPSQDRHDCRVTLAAPELAR